jgi:SAM-dependent methyltransferase
MDNRAGAGLSEYVLSQHAAPDLERARLAMLQEFYDALSARQLDAVGVGPGWRCLDVGAGGGSVTRMLAERVGPSGSVLAVDIDTSLLEPLASDGVQVRRHDLRSDPLPADTFDLVHARLLLMFLPNRLEAVRRLAAAVRPGGWVVTVAPDFTPVAVSPSGPSWERAWSVFWDAGTATGWDLAYGARLCSDMHAAGLVDVHCEYSASRAPGGSLLGRLLSLTLERLRTQMLALGADGDEIDDARRLLENPTSRVHSPNSCFARGRRPG